MAPVSEVGMVTGSVVPSAMPGEAPRMSLIAGVEMPAPPTPNMPARKADTIPMRIAPKTYIGSDLTSSPYCGGLKRHHIIVGQSPVSYTHLRAHETRHDLV